MTVAADPGGRVLDCLAVLDTRLAEAVAAARASYGPGAGRDAFRGLHIADDDVTRLLRRAPGESPVGPGGAGDVPGLGWLAERYGLSAFEQNVLIVAVAPEVDLRYERLYGYLQDDVTRRRPTIELTLNLLCRGVAEKLRRRADFAADAPLLRHRLVRLVADPHQVEPPLLARYVVADEQITDVLLGVSGLDRRLDGWCRLDTDAGEPSWGLSRVAELRALLEAGQRLYLRGRPGSSRRRIAAVAAGRPLLHADLALAPAEPAAFDAAMRCFLREAELFGALPYLDRADAVLPGALTSGTPVSGAPGDGLRWELAMRALAEVGGPVVLAGSAPWTPAAIPFAVVDFPLPDAGERRACWASALAGRAVADEDLDVLAERFPLTPRAIMDAAGTARAHIEPAERELGPAGTAGAVGAGETAGNAEVLGDVGTVGAVGVAGTAGNVEILGAVGAVGVRGGAFAALSAAARAQAGHELAALADRIEPMAGWDDLVLPDDELDALREVCARVAGQGRVLRDWGFQRKLGRGTGVGVLLAGPPGTGKTMAAEVVAGELHLDLYRINLADAVSKYIGETEKNLDRVFDAAGRSHAILLFDEADALLGKRSEVRDAHDRYANIEVAYLLQRMEAYEGVTLLATNMRHNLDEAFTRRLAFTVRFPFPDQAGRGRIWRGIWPSDAPLAADVDPDTLAERFPLSGGNIKNVAVAAAFLAGAGPITMADVLRAVRREYQKMGKTLTEDDLGTGDG
ncbi:ATP-binding protein [Nonomuraea sp. NPDC046802]|uniref:ATP-binding protein n=1 Tax=Nonomuraea sp. NPDC046802 TaxID=3154919 RepID=UPI003408CE0F